MGSSSGTSTGTTTQQLTPEQQQLVGLSMPGYQQFAGSGQPTLPTGNQAIAPFNPNQTAGQNAILGSTGGMGQTVGTAAGTENLLSSGAFLDPGSNPVVQNAIKAATQPIYQQLNTVTNPQQEAQGAAGSGINYGGSKEAAAEAINTQNANTAAGNVGANIANTALGQGLQATGQAVAQAPVTAASLAQPGATTAAVGDVQQQQAQNVLNANNQAQLQQWLLPLLQSQMLTQGAAATPGGTIQSTGQTTQQAAPWQIAAGLLSGAGSLFGGKGGLGAGLFSGGATA